MPSSECQALGKFLSEFKGFSLLDRSMVWTASVLQLEDTQRKIGKFALPVVPWTPCFDAGQFWPPIKKSSFRLGSGGSSSGSVVGISSTSVPLVFPILDDTQGGCGVGDPGDDEYIKYDKELDELLCALTASVAGEAGSGGGASSGSGAASSSGDPADPGASATSSAPEVSAVGAAAPKAGATKKGGGGKKYDHYAVHGETGEEIGFFLINANAQSLDMHCTRHNDCAISRSYCGFDDAALTTAMRCAKGRCAAFLVAWCRWGGKFSDRTSHMNARFCRGADAPLADGTGKERIEARKYVEETDSLFDIRSVERQPRVGEPIEPPGKF